LSERKRRIGENEAIFRGVNEEISSLNASFTANPKAMLIVCECGARSCTDRIEILPNEYGEVREDPTLFVLMPGHDFPETETVTAKRPSYWIVRKDPGLPAAIAEATDPGI
jgi:hypothetical protein